MLYNKTFTFILVACFSAAAFAQDPPAKPSATPAAPGARQAVPVEDEAATIDKASFLIGFNTISRLKQQEAEFNFEKLVAGLSAANDGREAGMTREEQRSTLVAYQQLIRAKIKAKREMLATQNGEEGEAALATFAEQEGAKELEDGVMYVVMQEGKGEKPEAADRVKLHYKGTYVDGEQFDSSIDKGEPLVNGVMQFVPGFTAALKEMQPGSKWKVMIRGDKAYGMRPRPPMEVNKTLVFEIELIEVMDIE